MTAIAAPVVVPAPTAAAPTPVPVPTVVPAAPAAPTVVPAPGAPLTDPAAPAAVAAAPVPGAPATPASPAAGDPPAKVFEATALVLPDGGPLDASDLEAIAAQATAKGWSQEQAQSALTEYADALTAQSTRFLSETEAHPEVGGAQLAASREAVRTVVDKFLPADQPEGAVLRAALNKTGYGNWSPLVVLLSRIGNAMKEDRPASPNAAAGATRRSHADVMFGDAKP